MLWIKEAEVSKSADDLMMSQSIEGHVFPDFEVIDAENSVCFEEDHH